MVGTLPSRKGKHAQNRDTRMGETLAQMRRSCVKKGKGTATEDSIFVKRI